MQRRIPAMARSGGNNVFQLTPVLIDVPANCVTQLEIVSNQYPIEGELRFSSKEICHDL